MRQIGRRNCILLLSFVCLLSAKTSFAQTTDAANCAAIQNLWDASDRASNFPGDDSYQNAFQNAYAQVKGKTCGGRDYTGCFQSYDKNAISSVGEFYDCIYNAPKTKEQIAIDKANAAKAALAALQTGKQTAKDMKSLTAPATPDLHMKANQYDAACVSKAISQLKDAYPLNLQTGSVPEINDAAAKLCQGSNAAAGGPNACFAQAYPQMQTAYVTVDASKKESPNKLMAAKMAVSLCQGAVANTNVNPASCFNKLYPDMKQSLASAYSTAYPAQAFQTRNDTGTAADTAAEICAGASTLDPQTCYYKAISGWKGGVSNMVIEAGENCEAVVNFCIGDSGYPDSAYSNPYTCRGQANYFHAPLNLPGSSLITNTSVQVADPSGAATKATK
jgi:hypothetical protein